MRQASKSRKKLQPVNKKNIFLSFILVFVGSCLLVFGGLNYFRLRILSFSKTPEPVSLMGEDENIKNGRIPVRIMIPSINIDLPVEKGSITDGVWQISYVNASYLDTSARPATGGNVVIYGHNKKVIFGNLPYVSKGQKIIIKTANGDTYDYLVTSKVFVTPDRVDLVSPTNTEELTLYTCWGALDSQRVVIKAKPIFSSGPTS